MFDVEGGRQRRPRAALESFKRSVGVGEEALRGPVAGEDKPVARVAGLDPALRTAFLVEEQDARRLLQEALAKRAGLESLPSGEGRVERLARAMGMLQLGHPDAAETLSEGLLQDEPGFFPASIVAAQAHKARREWAASESSWRELIRALPNETRLERQLGECLLWQDARKRAKGEEILERISATSDHHAVLAANALAAHYLRDFRSGEASRLLAGTLHRVGSSAELQRRLARAYWVDGKYDKAVALLEPLANRPSVHQAAAIHELILVHRGQLKFAAAADRYRTLVEGNFATFVGSMKDSIQGLGQDITKEQQTGRRVSWSLLELRCFLRRPQGVDWKQRQMALKALVLNKLPGIDSDLRYVLEHDPATMLRAGALEALLHRHPHDITPIDHGLRDREPLVRIKAALMLGRFPVGSRKARLFDALVREKHAATFRRLHGMLERESGESYLLESGVAEDEEARAAVCAEWARRLQFKVSERDASKAEGAKATRGGDKKE
jgi:tetratricopeptide (TPR) repeat protein